MGHSNWSDAAYQSRQRHRKAANTSAFTYDTHVRATGAVAVHPEMNPLGKIRESRDSAEHPESVAVAVIFDVTGSMGGVPRVLQTKLGALMRALIQKGYLAHPQLLFGAVGDAYSDRVPLQIGQFESGLEMDDDLGKIYLEGGGGGQVYESYELAFYFMARHTSTDCYERRGHKGYLFTIGDEKAYPQVRRDQVREHIGGALQRDVPLEQIVAEAQERYHCFHIIPTNTSHGRDPQIQQHWRQLLGERVLLLDDEAAVCETIALAIGLCEGALDNLATGVDDLVAAGADPAATSSAASALAPYAAARPAAPPVVAGLLPASGPFLELGDGRL
jgi:hypothetical protein